MLQIVFLKNYKFLTILRLALICQTTQNYWFKVVQMFKILCRQFIETGLHKANRRTKNVYYLVIASLGQ